jgi:hypothetical protein
MMGIEKSVALLSSAYLAPVQYYSKFLSYRYVIVEGFENYQKQSYRNRAVILAANGPLCLSIPVKEGVHVRMFSMAKSSLG